MTETSHDTALEQKLKQSKNEWQWRVLRMMNSRVIPSGQLITYGRLAELTNQEQGTSINARNVAALRRKLNQYRRDGTYEVPASIPLHRIAKKGDVGSKYDSATTRQENNRLRGEEGSLHDPRWV